MDPQLLDQVLGLPGVELQSITDILLIYIVLALRLGGFFLAAPFFGAQSVPVQVRIIATMSVALFLFGRVPVPDLTVLSTAAQIVLAFRELFIGLSAGLILSILFAVASLAGEKIATSSGLSFAMQIDPNAGGQTPVVSQILSLFLLAIF
jgi:Flagellar biosynthesis pathway, component FliR